MREIKFKAKRLDNDKWVYGFLLSERAIGKWGNSENYSYFAIQPETISQFTGMKDINGTDCYEGDIPEQNAPIEFREGCFFSGSIPLALVIEHRKIIGNIHD